MGSNNRVGYWLVSDGAQGFGVIFSAGNPAHKLGAAAKAVFAGTTEAAIRSSILSKGGSVTPQFGEVDVNATANTAFQHKLAWFPHTPSGAVADPTFTYLAAGAGAGGALASAFRSIVGAAELSGGVGADDPSTVGPKGSNGASGADPTKPADQPTSDPNSDPNSDPASNPSKSELAGKGLNIGALTLTGPDILRIVEVVGGVILVVMGLMQMSGRSGTHVVVQTAKAGAKAAGVAAV